MSARDQILEAATRVSRKWSDVRRRSGDSDWGDFSFYKGNARWASSVAMALEELNTAGLVEHDVCDAAEELIRSKSWDSDYEAPTAARRELLEAVAEIRAALPRRAERVGSPLLAAVYATPSDDAARLVYADWLSEKGDPRGAFITLQISRSAPREELTLLLEHRNRWHRELGSVGRLVSDRGLVYRRGFPALGVVRGEAGPHDDKAVNEEGWATFESLHFERHAPPDILFAPSLRALARATFAAGAWNLELVEGVVSHERAARWASASFQGRGVLVEFERGAVGELWRITVTRSAKAQEPELERWLDGLPPNLAGRIRRIETL
ncbi:MAG: TIGR02996 domain-containing protein [Polyangiaceae bacterium]